MEQARRREQTKKGYLEQVFSRVEKFTPDVIRLRAKHGITEDFPWTCAPNQQADFEQQFAKELERVGINSNDAKKRVHRSEIRVENGNTYIQFFEEKESEPKEICIQGIAFERKESSYGGGAYNILRTMSTLFQVVELLVKDHPEIAPLVEKAQKRKVEVEAIIQPEKIDALNLHHVDFQAIPGEVRESHIFSFRSKPFYFTDRFAEANDNISESENPINEICSFVVQQIEELDLEYILERQGKQNRRNFEQTDSMFLLMPKDLVDKGIKDKMVQETLGKSDIVSLNLDEAATLFGQVPIEEYTPESERELSAKFFAQKIHALGTETVVITDADKGAYISSRQGIKNGHFYWKKFGIDEEMGGWVEQLKYRLTGESSQLFLKPGEKFNATGCGDSFAATIQFCRQVLGLRDWNFIISFASKIAGIVLRIREANIGNIDPQLILELLRSAGDKKDIEPWLPIGIQESIPSVFDFQKTHDLENIQDNVRHEIIILVGAKGVGKHELIRTLREDSKKPNTKIHEILESSRVKMNALIPFSTKEGEKDETIGDAEFDQLLADGKLVGAAQRPDGSRYAFKRSELIVNQHEGHTIDILLADSPRQAINMWRALMEESKTTRVKIVHLYDGPAEDELREQHSKQIAKDSGGFDFSFNAKNEKTLKERSHVFLRKLIVQFEEDVKTPLY